MLRNLYVQNYALIDKLEIEFQEGLTVITGETGAGKSILLGALSLALGQRADLSSLKNTGQKCIIEVTFDIARYKLEYFFDENDLDYADISILRREITPKGKSRAFINDTPVNLTQLSELGEQLIDIHSQHQNLELNRQSFQMNFLDLVAGNNKLLQKYGTGYQHYQQILQEIEALKSRNRQQKERSDFIQYQFEELKNAQLSAGEQKSLEKEQELLSNSEEIADNLKSLLSRFQREEYGISQELSYAKNELSKIAQYFDNGEELVERVSSALLDLDDLAADLEQKTEQINHDPGKLERINQRLNLIYTLQQKHGKKSIDELLELQAQYETELNDLGTFDEQLSEMNSQLTKTEKEMTAMAAELHQKRESAAKKISKAITGQLAGLGMPQSLFRIDVEKTATFDAYGHSAVTFKYATDRQMTPKAITKVASGGELSRIMLIIKSIIAAQKALPTIIFDEIDAGVSGEIADKMGNIIQDMAEHMQIISITHLPQIAAKGKHHSIVYKIHEKSGASTKIRFLNEEERVEVIARMLSSDKPTRAALENAQELLGR